MEEIKDHSRVIFSPSGMRVRVRLGTQLDQAACDIGVDLQSLCGGKGKCAKCRVRVIEGSPDGLGQSSCSTDLSVPTQTEKNILSVEELSEGWRLVCQVRVLGDVVVEAPDESRSGKQIICKDPGCQSVALEPMVRRHRFNLCA